MSIMSGNYCTIHDQVIFNYWMYKIIFQCKNTAPYSATFDYSSELND